MIALLAAAPAAGLLAVRQIDDFEQAPISYSKTTPDDAVTKLQKRIDAGEVKLEFEPGRGYLRSVLRNLAVPATSQILVFSKTSFQRDRISPQAPRALYFNDRTYVGFVQNAPVLEFTAVDPQLGAVFYTLDQQAGEKPKFRRQDYECLQCHAGSMTSGVPGHVMRSVYARPDGQPEFRAGSFITTDASPLRERWGGWYVTGTCGKQHHMGNAFARGAADAVEMDLEAGSNVTDLSKLVDTTPYLTRHSDIVALMVIEHQTHLQNLITRASYETRRALTYEQMLNKELGRPADYRSDSTLSRVRSVGEPLVKGLLFSGEEKLTDRVAGTSGFAQEFGAQGPRDPKGRSLRELDLTHRLLKYPLSWTIYSAAFDALPDLARNYVYRRLTEVLTGKDQSPDFANLSTGDRDALLEILTATKPTYATWRSAHP